MSASYLSLNSSLSTSEIQDLRTNLMYARALSYFQMANVIVLLYDLLLISTREVDLFRRRRWSLVSILHFIVRISSFLDNGLTIAIVFSSSPSNNECESWHSIQTWIFLSEYFAVECIFIIRTYAVWDNSKRIGIFLFTLLVILAACSAVLLNFFYRGSYTFVNNTGLFNGIYGCYGSNISHLIWMVYLVLLVHESAILFLTIFKTYRYRKSTSTSLYRTLFIDGILFYICIVFISILNIVIASKTYDFTNLALGLALLHRNLNTVLCIRLMFNIRKAVDRENAGSCGEVKQRKRCVPDGVLVESEVL